MARLPLNEVLWAHQKKKRASFHTPGHKNSPDFFKHKFWALDETELPDTDGLFEAIGAILQAENEAAKLFGTKKTLFSAGGCTLCIQAIFKLCAPSGGKIIAGRIVHRSAVNAMALLGLEPVWVYPLQDAGAGMPGRIGADDIEAALAGNPDATAVYITSPDYYGVISDISEIAKRCAKYAVPLVVDAAHGAHLPFVAGELSPLISGASMVATSPHKTLPVLTGGAWLHILDDRFCADAKDAMALFGSTSPSYPIMASLDWCRAWLEENGRDAFAALTKRVARIKNLANKKGLLSPQGPCDPVRISLNTANIGVSGQAAAEHFRAHSVEPEYADDTSVILIPSPFNSEGDFEKLESAIDSLKAGQTTPQKSVYEIPKPPVCMNLREAILAPSETVVLSEALGRIAAQASCPCPPGVPVVMPGEKITSETIDFLSAYGISTVKVIQ